MKKNRFKIIFFIIIVISLWVRLIGLDRGFVLDEYRTIVISQLPLDGIFESIKQESYPPFSFAALSLWINIAQNDTWIRLFFVLFGMLSVLFVYLIGREISNRRFALLAMFFMALMPMQVWASQYVRGIGPAILFSLISTLFFIKLLQRDRCGKAILAGYVLSTALAAYSFYFTFFVILSQNIVYLIKKINNKVDLMKWMFLQICVFVLFLPWLNGFFTQMKGADIAYNVSVRTSPGFNMGRLQIGTYIRCLSGVFGIDQDFLSFKPITQYLSQGVKVLFVAGLLLFLILGVYAFMRVRRKANMVETENHEKLSNNQVLIYFSLFAFMPLVVSLLLNMFVLTPAVPRYFAISSAFMVFVYALLVSLTKSKKILYFSLLFFVIFSFARISDFTQTPIAYKASAEYVEKHMSAGDCLLFVNSERIYKYYCSLPEHFIGSDEYLAPIRQKKDVTPPSLVDEDALKRKLESYDTVWIYNSGNRVDGVAAYVLRLLKNSGFNKCETLKFKNIEVYKCMKRT